MEYYTIEEDTSGVSITPGGRDITQRDRTTVQIISNDDAATVTVGFIDDTDTFNAYPDGDITTTGGAVINHGFGTELAVSVSGIATEAVKLGVSVY